MPQGLRTPYFPGVTISKDGERSLASTDGIDGLVPVVLWYLLGLLATELTVTAHLKLLGADNFRRYWPYDSEIGLAAVICVISLHKPRIFRLSRWRIRWWDVAVGTAAGVVIAAVQLLLAPETFNVQLPDNSMIPIVLLGPIVEEILFRGMFLGSLRDRFNPLAAILVVTLMAAVPHSSFWMALFPQFVFCVLYLYLKRSLFASVSSHIVSNAILFFPILRDALEFRVQ